MFLQPQGIHTIKWADCQLHNPTTSSQTAKDFEAMHKTVSPPKSNTIASGINCHSNLPPCCNFDIHTTDCVENSQHPTCCRSCFCSCSCSSSFSHDLCHKYCRKHCSYGSYHNSHFVGHHDFLSKAKSLAYDTMEHDSPLYTCSMLIHILMVLTIWNGPPTHTKNSSSGAF